MILTGNATTMPGGNPGWFVGSFLPPESPLQSTGFEVKWGTHKAGEGKPGVGVNAKCDSLAILISGRFKFIFSDREVILENQGDLVFYNKGTHHAWEAVTDCVILTIRWPSIPGDQIVHLLPSS